MKIAVIDYLYGNVSINNKEAHIGDELKYSDILDTSLGKCIIKFKRSNRLLDISYNKNMVKLGSLAYIEEKNIPIGVMYGCGQ